MLAAYPRGGRGSNGEQDLLAGGSDRRRESAREKPGVDQLAREKVTTARSRRIEHRRLAACVTIVPRSATVRRDSIGSTKFGVARVREPLWCRFGSRLRAFFTLLRRDVIQICVMPAARRF